MRNRNEDLQQQYRATVDEAARRYRAGVDSLNDGYRTARNSYRDRTRERDEGSSLLGMLAITAVAGAAAFAAAPYVRRLLDEQSGEGEGGKDVSATIQIDRPAQELYDRWRSFEDFDAFMPDVVHVEKVGDGSESDWTVRGPGGQELEFHSRIIEDEPGRTIAWESNDQPAGHKGRVSFREMGSKTEVRLELQLHPPAGALGAAVARLLGKASGTDPKQQADRALRQFKRLMERDSGSSRGKGSPRAPQSDPISSMGASNGIGGSPAGSSPI